MSLFMILYNSIVWSDYDIVLVNEAAEAYKDDPELVILLARTKDLPEEIRRKIKLI